MSWIYLRAPLREPPVFVRRSLVGLYGGGGTEERALTLGYSSITATTPREEAVYQLEFDSHHPLDPKFVVTAPEEFEESKPNQPLN